MKKKVEPRPGLLSAPMVPPCPSTIRLASEYASLADQYARDQHLGRYRVIPLSGASEGFVPEDAEILI